MRRHLVLLLALAGCKYLDQPKKVAELEKRLDEVSSVLTEMTGEPVGERPGAKAKHDDEEEEDEDGAKDKRKKGKDDKSARKGKDSKKDAKESRDSKKGAKQAKGDDEEDEDAKVSSKKRRADDEERDEEGEDADPEAEAAAAAPPPNVHWSYEGEEGPAAWAKLAPAFAMCAKGEQQSPIDILPRPTKAPEVIFVYHPSAATVIDNGHTLEVDLEPGSFIVIDGDRYELVQFHVHTPSEHTIAGDSFPMELHLVHKSKAGKLAVVGVLYTEGEASTALAPIWKGPPKTGALKLKKFDPEALLPKDRTAYRYDGSLTTPPCTEGVIWHVLRRPRTEADRTIAAFQKRFGANARPTQELHERELP